MIFTDNVTKLVKVFEKFRKNYQKREKYKIELVEKKRKYEESISHGILKRDPPFSLFEASNRN